MPAASRALEYLCTAADPATVADAVGKSVKLVDAIPIVPSKFQVTLVLLSVVPMSTPIPGVAYSRVN